MKGGQAPTPDDAMTKAVSSRTVLVPLDGSTNAGEAIPIAREAARNLGATIRLLHVSDTPLSRTELLESVALQPESLTGAVLESVCGAPSEVIVRVAAELDVALIVMCTTGWTGTNHRRIGHVAQEVLRKTTCPLILVTPEVERAFQAGNRRLKRLLLPLDGSPLTLSALEPAVEIASMCDSDLDVLHVVGTGTHANRYPGTLSVPRYQDQPHLIVQQWTREFLRRFCSGFPRPPDHVLVEVGDPAEAIVRVAQELHSDLILIAWSGTVGPDRARTAMTVLRNAPCPVMFLRTSPESVLDGVPAIQSSPP